MLNDCQKFALAINARETPFPTEPLIMALLLTQHKMISWLSEQVSLQKLKPVNQSRAAGRIQRFNLRYEMKSSGLSIVGLTCSSIFF